MVGRARCMAVAGWSRLGAWAGNLVPGFGRGSGIRAQPGLGAWPADRARCWARRGEGGTPSCWSAGSVQNRAGSVTGARSIAGGGGTRHTGTPGLEVPLPGQPRRSPPVPGHSIVSPVAPPLHDVTGGVTLGRSLQAAWVLPALPARVCSQTWGRSAPAPGLAPTSPPVWAP